MLVFGSSLIMQESRWTAFKAILGGRPGLPIQYEDVGPGDIYDIFAVDESIVYRCIIFQGSVPTASDYSQEQNDSDRDDWETNFKAGANKANGQRDVSGRNLIVPEPRIGREIIYVTPNFCDRTTWYQGSSRSTEETLVDTSDGLIWAAEHPFWIDMTHGKISDENAYILEADHRYAVVVTVDGIEKTARSPFSDEGGDYVVDYNVGTITFSESQAGKAVVCSYSYESGSDWAMVPDNGTYIDMEKTKVQWSKNMEMFDSLEFEVWVYNPYDLPNKVMYSRTTYKKMDNFLDEAEAFISEIPATGGSKRGTTQSRYAITFRYGTVRRLKSSQGAELRIRLKNGISFGGERATGTFYCTVHDE